MQDDNLSAIAGRLAVLERRIRRYQRLARLRRRSRARGMAEALDTPPLVHYPWLHEHVPLSL